MVVVAALLQLCQHILLVFRNTVHRGDWRQSNLKGPWALAFRLSMPISTHPIDVLLSPNPRGRALGQTPYSRSAFLRPYIRRPSLDCAPIDAPIVVNGYSLRVLIPSSRVSNLSLTPREAAAKILAADGARGPMYSTAYNRDIPSACLLAVGASDGRAVRTPIRIYSVHLFVRTPPSEKPPLWSSPTIQRPSPAIFMAI